MKKEHWICGGAGCEAPLFRRSFWLDKTERFQSAHLEICGLGYFLFYINGKRISDQELMPAMTDYASVLGCETTYPVWEERSAHRCRYLSFDLLPYLKAGENVLAVRLGNGWYHQTERIAEGKFVFGLPKLWFELTLTDADGRQEWIESDRQTLWHPGGLLKNNLFLGEVRDLRKEPEGWQYPGALCFPALEKKENALRYAMQRSWQQMVRWILNRRAAAISCSRIIISATEGYRHCIRCFVGMAFVILRRRVHVRCCVQR